MAVLLASTGDWHCGSTVAVCPPRIELDDGGAYEASPAQRWLWHGWLEYWDWVARLRDEHRAELYFHANGDLVDGAHHQTTQILTGNPTAQAAVVDACMHVPMQLAPDRLFFVRGTEAHVGKSASSEERIALGLLKDGRPVQPDPDTGRASWWRLRAEIEGVPVDAAHHGRMGQRPWTRPNIVANLAAEIFYQHARDGEPYPRLSLRSHFHQYVDTYDQHPVRVIQMPAWQLATAYVHRIAAEGLADIGGLAVLFRDGDFEVHKFLRRPSRGQVWRAA